MRIFYFLLIVCCYQIGSAQTYSALVNATPRLVDEVDVSQLKENQLYISMPFTKKTVLNPGQKKQLQERAVVKLELIYTKYRKSIAFNQKNLNKKRLKELNQLVPSLFENRFWEFDLVSQTNGSSPEVCGKMFHGFIVTFRPNSTTTTLDLEANYLEILASSLSKKDSLGNDSIPKNYEIKTHYDKQFGYIHDTVWFIDAVDLPDPPDFFYDQSLYNDSTVLNTFERNKHWKNFIVVTDVTGSMSPYISQVFVWLKEQAEKKAAKYFVFFNDGNNKASKKKKPLETGGVYITKNKNLETVIKTTTKCMRSGSGGGENLENDIEAIVDGAKQYPDADEIILVADNLESMRDYKYIKKINNPVHVVLCGAKHRVNIQYLDLARQTGGTIHTGKSDIKNLQNIKNGEHFFIDEKEYMFQNERFHSVYKNNY